MEVLEELTCSLHASLSKENLNSQASMFNESVPSYPELPHAGSGVQCCPLFCGRVQHDDQTYVDSGI